MLLLLSSDGGEYRMSVYQATAAGQSLWLI
jgi:hypothetical protein